MKSLTETSSRPTTAFMDEPPEEFAEETRSKFINNWRGPCSFSLSGERKVLNFSFGTRRLIVYDLADDEEEEEEEEEEEGAGEEQANDDMIKVV